MWAGRTQLSESHHPTHFWEQELSVRFVRVGLGGPGQEVGYRRMRGAGCAGGELFPGWGGCGSGGGTLTLRVSIRGMKQCQRCWGSAPPAWPRPAIEFPSALPFYGQKPLQWRLLGRTPVLGLSPAPWAAWKQSQCWSHGGCHSLVGHPGLCQV